MENALIEIKACISIGNLKRTMGTCVWFIKKTIHPKNSPNFTFPMKETSCIRLRLFITRADNVKM